MLINSISPRVLPFQEDHLLRPVSGLPVPAGGSAKTAISKVSELKSEESIKAYQLSL